MKKQVKISVAVGVAILLVCSVAYAAWTHNHSVRINGGIMVGEDADPGAKKIRFEECGPLDPGYIHFSSGDDNYIVGLSVLEEFLTMYADTVIMHSGESGAMVIAESDGDVVVKLGS